MQVLSLIEKFYPRESEIFNVLTVHSQQVAERALQVADRHPELQLNRTFLYEASMLHDIGILMCDAPRIHCHGSHQYIEHGYIGADLLRAEGWPEHALVCERHTGVGLTLETIVKNRLPLPHRDMVPVRLEEQVICYADKFFSKTQLNEEHSLERIRTYLGHFGQSEVERFDDWHRLFW